MEIAIYIAVFLLIAGGLAGCFLPVIPGPPLAFAGYLLLLLTPAAADMSWTAIGTLGALTLLSVVFDFVIPAVGVKVFGGTSWGKWGCLIGTILGLFIMPWGLVAGPFLGAFLAELMGNQTVGDAFRSGIGSLLGFLCGTFFKIIVSVSILVMAIKAVC